MKKQRKKRSVTLIEIMIVILLIGMIGGALAFNMRGSVDKGKVFKSEQNANRVYDVLMMANATGDFELKDISEDSVVENVLKKSPFAKDGEKLLKDAWGEKLKRALSGTDDIEIYSQKARDWTEKHQVNAKK